MSGYKGAAMRGHWTNPFTGCAFKMAMLLPPTPRQPVKEKKLTHQTSKLVLSDAQVLDARTKFEFEGWSRRKVAEHFGLTDEYARRLLDYTVRSKLIPQRPK